MTTPACDAIDFFADTSVHHDPYPYYRAVRAAHGPVWIEPHHGVAMVTGLDEAMAVYRDPDAFSSCNAATGPFPGLPEQPEGDDAAELIERHRAEMPLYGYMVTWDAPEHHDHRSLLTRLFTPRRLRDNEDFMWRLAGEEIDKFLPTGSCEFITEYSSPFTMFVIADLLGVPHDDLPRFRRWFRRQTMGAIDAAPDPDDPSEPRRRGGTRDVDMPGFFEETFAAYIEDRRRHPRGDVLTHLAQVTFPDGSTPDISILANEAAFLFAAGQETTARSLAFALQHLADEPDLQAELRAQRDLVPRFVEEILRLESPVKDHFRMARRTTTLAGVEIPAGTSVMLMLGAINRDPRVFDEPDELRLDRPNQFEQVAFGKGAHSCLGQQLARVEMRVSLEVLFDRTADIAVSQEHHGPADDRRYRYDRSSLFRSLRELHLELAPSP